MNLGNLKLLVGAALFFATTACVSGQTPKPTPNAPMENQNSSVAAADSFIVGKFNFDLTEKDNQCVLSYRNGGKTQELILEIAPPCRVVTDNNKKIRSFNYKDIKAQVAMIVGGVTETSGKECGDQAQVFLVKNRTVELGKVQKGAVCVLYGTDEKKFWMLSH